MAKRRPSPPKTSASKPGRAKPPPLNPQVQFLVMSLTHLVTEMVQAKCQTLNNREKKTLERRILKAVQLFAHAPAGR
jgi:hypothetical protein